MTTETTTLRDLAWKVQRAREQEAHLEAQVAEARRAWEWKHRALLDSLSLAKAERLRCEDALRAATLAAYHETGNKAPGPGVAIRMVKRVVYDGARALAWAREHGMFLSLDSKAFERFAREHPNQVEGVVEVVEEPTATIAQDLATVLEEGAS